MIRRRALGDPAAGHALVVGLWLLASAPTTAAGRDALPIIVDLAPGIRTGDSIRLEWSAPEGTGRRGRGTAYEIRFSTERLDDSTWTAASSVPGVPPPGPAGHAETFTVTGLRPGQAYWFGIRWQDGATGAWSAVSRVKRAETPPLEGRMVCVPPQRFEMGSPGRESGRDGSERRHPVILTRGFFISDHEVTQGEWRDIMGANPSEFTGIDERPVEQVSWYDALEYCNRRSLRELLTPVYELSDSMVSWNYLANGYRLPTEAEWECACRAGSRSAVASGELTSLECGPVDPSLDLVAWYCANAGDRRHRIREYLPDSGGRFDLSHPVRQKCANAWGLYDMHGNVAEWCWDFLGSYPMRAVDPFGPLTGTFRVLRGGSRYFDASACRSASRTGAQAGSRSSLVGFRVARTANLGLESASPSTLSP